MHQNSVTTSAVPGLAELAYSWIKG